MDSILRISESSKGKKRRPELLSEDQFRALVLYECARCDRNHHQFSLVQVELHGETKKRQVEEFTRKVLKRIRATDEAGWLNNKSLGIFLPETGREGASTFARTLVGDLVYQIYTYPDFHTVDSGAQDQNNNRDSSNKRSGNTGIQPDNPRSDDSTDQRLESSSISRISIVQDVESIAHQKGLPVWKRTVDIVGAAAVLVLSSPFWLMLTAYIKAVSRGPVLFKQERIGYLGRPFTIYKFRTMKTDADCDVHKNHLKDLIGSDKVLTKLDENNDGRLIPLAGLIRKSCLDELPQLLNVLKGEMSLVGPRPLLSYEVEEFAAWQRQRMHTVPGMTGLWQVSGKNSLTFSQMMRLDARYSRKTGLVMDMVIFFKTIPAIWGQVMDSIRGKMACRKPKEKTIPVWSRFLSNLVRQLFL